MKVVGVKSLAGIKSIRPHQSEGEKCAIGIEHI